MAAFGLETHKLSHSELTTGHDVECLLSQIGSNLKQSKADQIFRLLKDQDKLTKKLEERDWDDENILKDIKEDKVAHDSDTLTDDSVDESDKQTDDERVNVIRFRGRCKTSMGFYAERRSAGLDISDDRSMEGEFEGDTRFNRPKSSYVRRRPYRRKDEVGGEGVGNENEFEPLPQRPTRSARPKSRLGRSSVPEAERSRRKIALTEANINLVDETIIPVKDEISDGANIYEKFASTRNPVPKMKAKGFCDDITQLMNQHESVENHSVGNNSVEMQDVVQELQPELVHTSKTMPHHRHNVQHQRTVANVAPTPIHSPSETFHSRSPHGTQHINVMTEHIQNRNTPSPRTDKKSSNSPVRSEMKNPYTQARSESNLSHAHLRSESNLSQGSPHKRQEQSDNSYSRPREQTDSFNRPKEQTDSYVRPKNPEPVTSRPISRPNARRRFQRRYMPQTAAPLSNVRPTSESVILARQKTEKNLLKAKQEDSRPKSEKIFQTNSKTMLSVSSNPAQGPQTSLMSKAGITQASHVPSTGFRGYEPGNRLKSGSLNRKDLPADLTLPRQGPNNVVLGGRKPLALMKLPPLEAALAKKKEASLQIAARETCV